MHYFNRKQRWGLILAAGEGVRLRPLTRFICKDERPKQFCPLYGGTTLLEQARKRAEQNIWPERILFSLNREHEDFYLRSLVDCPAQRVVQPCNRGTVPAILTGLRLIGERDPEACVAVFPSDHWFSDESRFSTALESAFDLANRYTDYVVLMGAVPDRPETEYGWIEPAEALDGELSAFCVRGFHEKPPEPAAKILMEQGCLWNTFVMVGRVRAFLELVGLTAPGLLRVFRQWHFRHAPGEEIRIEESLYQPLPTLDFSRQILAAEPGRLIVHQLDGLLWNDLGDCERAVAAVSLDSKAPDWVAPWRAAARSAYA